MVFYLYPQYNNISEDDVRDELQKSHFSSIHLQDVLLHGDLQLVKWFLAQKSYALSGGDERYIRAACRSGNLDLVKYVLEIAPDANINARDVNQKTAFNYACQSGCVDLVKWMHTNILYIDYHCAGNNSFIAACGSGNLGMVQWWLAEFPKTAIHEYPDALVQACISGNLEIVELITNATPQVDVHWGHDLALRRSCEYGYLNIAQHLRKIAPNIDANTQQEAALSALRLHTETCDHAISDIDKAIFKYMRKNARVNHKLVKWLFAEYPSIDAHADQEYMFQNICKNGNVALAKWFYNTVPNIDAQIIRNTVFYDAFKMGNIKMVSWLSSIIAYIDVEFIDKKILPKVCASGDLVILKWLWAKYPTMDLGTQSNAPIINACRSGNLDMVKWVYSTKPDIPIAKISDELIHIISANNNPEFYKWLSSIVPNIGTHASFDKYFRTVDKARPFTHSLQKINRKDFMINGVLGRPHSLPPKCKSSAKHVEQDDARINMQNNAKVDSDSGMPVIVDVLVGGSNDEENPFSSDTILHLMKNVVNMMMDNPLESADEPAESADVVQQDVFCPGINCDHDELSQNVPVMPNVDAAAITLQTFIDIGAAYHCKLQTHLGDTCLLKIANIRASLVQLAQLVGMQDIKQNLLELVIYFLSETEPNPSELLHTVITGPPGAGKTHAIKILAQLYVNMGYLTKTTIHHASITDLKGKYLGHTANLTQRAIDKAMGGVLVIDEAYSLASADKIDSFSKEIIDVLNKNLTDNAGKFICIIAGYEQAIQDCIFAHNPGMASRFRFKFRIEKYNHAELQQIFASKLAQNNWQYHAEISAKQIDDFFKRNYEQFKYYGRDMETLLFHVKLVHCKRALFNRKNKGIITMRDLETGMLNFMPTPKSSEQHMSFYV